MRFFKRIKEPNPLDVLIANLMTKAEREESERQAERSELLNEMDRRLRENEDMEPGHRQEMAMKVRVAREHGWQADWEKEIQ